jgi:putative transposase
MQLKIFKYRIYPSKRQKEKMITSFRICKEIYNTLLSFNKTEFITNKFEFNGIVTNIKHTCPQYYFQVYGQCLQNIADRLSRSLDDFFRRCKDGTCKKKGFPRFKKKVSSITYPQRGFKIISNKIIKLNKIGSVPIILHRVPKGKIKTLTIKQNKIGQWFAFFVCELPEKAIIHPSTEKIGIDVGLESLAVLSDGQVITNPRYLIQSEARLKILHRRLSRKKKGSANRRKANFRLAKQHLKVSNQRTDFLHKLSRKITTKFFFIAVENLKIKNMVKNHVLAKGINDASWGSFINMLSYKAVTSGGRLVKVDPRNTSKTCSKCGTIVEMPLSKREFVCSHCGFVCHRDLNAPINILKVGTDCSELNACEHNVRPSLGKAVVDEAGTIMTEPSTSSVIGSPIL